MMLTVRKLSGLFFLTLIISSLNLPYVIAEAAHNKPFYFQDEGKKRPKQPMLKQSTLLDKKLNIKIYGAETLESIIFRLEALTTERFIFDANVFSGYKAKIATYENTPLSHILQEQLQGTSLKYQLNDSKLSFMREGK